MFPAGEKVKIGESKVLLLLWLLFTTVKLHWIILFDSIDCHWLETFFHKKEKLHYRRTQEFSLKIKIIQSSPLLIFFPKMATFRKKRRLAAVSRETQEYPRNSQLQNSSGPGITEEYIAQVSEEIERWVTKELSLESRRTECSILGALSKLYDFSWTHRYGTFSGTVPVTFRNADVEKQEPSGDRSQSDPHLEVEFPVCRASNLTDSDPEKISHGNILSNKKRFLLSETQLL